MITAKISDIPATRICRSGIVCGGGHQPIENFGRRPDGKYGRRAHCNLCLRVEWKFRRLRKRYAADDKALEERIDSAYGKLVSGAFTNRLIGHVRGGATAAADRVWRALEIRFRLSSVSKGSRVCQALARVIERAANQLIDQARREAIDQARREGKPMEPPRGRAAPQLVAEDLADEAADATRSRLSRPEPSGPTYPTDEEMAERARREEERLRRMGVQEPAAIRFSESMAPDVTIGDATDAELEWEKEVRARLQAEDEARERDVLGADSQAAKSNSAAVGRIQQRQPAEERTPERRELEHVEEQARPPVNLAADIAPTVPEPPPAETPKPSPIGDCWPAWAYKHLGLPVPPR
jgi:hypothetical protein